MFWSKLFIPTLREGNRLLARAGYMRGRDYLFLGRRTLSKIVSNIRREMASIGAQEVLIAGSVRDIAAELRSYRQLPQIWFQFDGFSMKSYSFDLGDGAFNTMAAALERLCESQQEERVQDIEGDFTPEEFHTPGQKSIADISNFTGLPPTVQMKSLVVVADGEIVLALVRGDHQLNEEKLAWYLNARELRPATGEQIRETFGADAGSLGPVGVKARVICDEALRGRRNLICGANRNDYHLRHVTPGKDFHAEFHDIREDRVSIMRMRHARSPLQVSNEQAALVDIMEGAGEIFLDRWMEFIAERHQDSNGLVWPVAVAPFAAVISPVNFGDEEQRKVAIGLHDSAPFDVLLDDRDERPGVKFKDADLIGIPYRITLGEKLTQGMVEIRDRAGGVSHDVRREDAIEFIRKMA